MSYFPSTGIVEVRSTATAGNLNSGAFNPANANFPTDGVISSGTGNSPTISSATYSFVTGDIGYHVYLPAQTNIAYAGWYEIASVSAGVATLKAAIGEGNLYDLNSQFFFAQLTAGCASTSSLTSVKYGIDYSQNDMARYSGTDLTGATTSCSSASVGFGPNLVGNSIHAISGTGLTAGWQEIVSVSGGTATLSASIGTSYSSATFYIGGAISLGGGTSPATDTNALSFINSDSTSGGRIFIKGGPSGATYTAVATIGTANGYAANPLCIEGYGITRGDRPRDNTRPTLAMGTYTFGGSTYNNYFCLKFTYSGTGTCVNANASSSCVFYCDVTGLSSSGGGTAIQTYTSSMVVGCTVNGPFSIGIYGHSYGNIIGNYVRGCATGISLNGNTTFTVVGNILNQNIIGMTTSQNQSAGLIENNTIYGSFNIPLNRGWLSSSSVRYVVWMNNIIYGYIDGVYTSATADSSSYQTRNCFYGNTTDIHYPQSFQKGLITYNLDPQFVNTERYGTTGYTASGNLFIDANATFQTWGITPGTDMLCVVSGTGVTSGSYPILSVDSETQLTLGTRTIGVNAITNKNWVITQGQNFTPGSNLKALGFPDVVGPNANYMDLGAIQRQEPTGGAAGGSFTFAQ